MRCREDFKRAAAKLGPARGDSGSDSRGLDQGVGKSRRVAVVSEGRRFDRVLGFYTLSALSIDLASLSEQLSRELPRHPVPCALIGRLAVDRSAHGRGLGRMLLADTVSRPAVRRLAAFLYNCYILKPTSTPA